MEQNSSFEMYEGDDAELDSLREKLAIQETYYQQLIAYIVATKLDGSVSISDQDFSPLELDFNYQYSYNTHQGIAKILGKSEQYNGDTAYGIKIASRAKKSSEIAELVNFAKKIIVVICLTRANFHTNFQFN